MPIILEHPEISCIERTGYPSWMQETEVMNDEDDEDFYEDDEESWDDGYEDWLYDQKRDRELFGD